MSRSSRMLVVGFLAALAFGVTTGVGNILVDLVATARGFRFAIERGLVVGLLHGLAAGRAFGLVYGVMSGRAPRAPSRVRIQIIGETRERRAHVLHRFMLGLETSIAAQHE